MLIIFFLPMVLVLLELWVSQADLCHYIHSYAYAVVDLFPYFYHGVYAHSPLDIQASCYSHIYFVIQRFLQ